MWNDCTACDSWFFDPFLLFFRDIRFPSENGNSRVSNFTGIESCERRTKDEGLAEATGATGMELMLVPIELACQARPFEEACPSDVERSG